MLLVTGTEKSAERIEAKLHLSLQPLDCPPDLRPGGLYMAQFYSNSHLLIDDENDGMNVINLRTGATTHAKVECDLRMSSIATELTPSESMVAIILSNGRVIVTTVSKVGCNKRKSTGDKSVERQKVWRWKPVELSAHLAKMIIISGELVMTHNRQDEILRYNKTGKNLDREELPGGFKPQGLAKYDKTNIIITGINVVSRLTYPEFEPVWQTELKHGYGVSVDDQGLIYVGVWIEKKIVVLTSSGKSTSVFPLQGRYS